MGTPWQARGILYYVFHGWRDHACTPSHSMVISHDARTTRQRTKLSSPHHPRSGVAEGLTTLPSKGGAHMGAKLRALTKAKIGTMTAVKQGFEQQG